MGHVLLRFAPFEELLQHRVLLEALHQVVRIHLLLDEVRKQRAHADRQRVAIGVDEAIAEHAHCRIAEKLDRRSLVRVQQETILDLLAGHVHDLFDSQRDVVRRQLTVKTGFLGQQ